MDPTSVAAYEELARQHLSPSAWGYYAGGSGNHVTLHRNLAAFERIQLLPRMLRGIERASIDTTVLGTHISMPIMVAPMAMQGLAHAGADCATARAAGSLGTLMVAATEASRRLEDIASATPAPLWFQLYMYRRRDIAQELVRRAEEAGFRAIVLTLDARWGGRWEHNDAPVEAAPGIENANFLTLEGSEMELAALSWNDIAWLRSLTDLPIVLKGILTVGDARQAVEAGAAAIVVSNHGGRTLDGVPASIEVLPEIAAAVGDRIEVYLDGGVRRGTDVLKAIALGARAVLVGRPVLWGLAVAGEAGVRNVLELLRDDLAHAMVLAGCADLSEVGPHLIRIADWRTSYAPGTLEHAAPLEHLPLTQEPLLPFTGRFPAGTADEKELYLRWLRYLRGAVVRKLQGVSDEDARWTPDGALISLLGIVNHLTHVEWRWIDGGMRGEEVSRSEEEFRPGPELTVESALAAYRERAMATDAVVRSMPLTAPSRRGENADLRWVLLHLINETARHAGHADAVRELLDGTTGE